MEREAAQGWLGAAMARPTNCEDTHPALNERLAARGEEANFNPPEPGQASDTLLGLSPDATIKALDAPLEKHHSKRRDRLRSRTHRGRDRTNQIVSTRNRNHDKQKRVRNLICGLGGILLPGDFRPGAWLLPRLRDERLHRDYEVADNCFTHEFRKQNAFRTIF